MQYPEILKEYLDYTEVILGRAPSTTKEYGYDISNFLQFIKKSKENLDEKLEDIHIIDIPIKYIKDVTIVDLHSYMAYLEKSSGNSPRTRSRKVSSLRSFYKYLVQVRELFSENVTDKLSLPKTSTRNPVYLTLEESEHLLNTILEETKNPTFRTRDYAMVSLFLNCGLRVSEVQSINISDIKDHILKVIGKGDKERYLYLNESCITAIQEYLKYREPKDPEEDALFLSNRRTRISVRAIQRRVDHYLKLAGFDTNLYSTHKLRHTAATLMYQHGNADIRVLQEILGHESVQTTQIYTHLDNDIMKNALDNNPLNKKSK